MIYSNPWERFCESMLRYAEAGDDDREFVKAKDLARKNALHWAAQAFLGKDAEIRVVVYVKRPKSWPAGQLGLWPVRRTN